MKFPRAKIPQHVGSISIHMDHHGSIYCRSIRYPSVYSLFDQKNERDCPAVTLQMALNLEDVDDINNLEELKPMISTSIQTFGWCWSVDAWIEMEQTYNSRGCLSRGCFIEVCLNIISIIRSLTIFHFISLSTVPF